MSWPVYDYWLEHRFDGLITVAAVRYHVDPALIKAVIWRESRFHPGRRGRAGEIGLMQLREAAAAEWAAAERIPVFDHEACLDPTTNVFAGSWYLKSILRRYPRADDPLPYALADYNAGRANVLKWQLGPAATNSQLFLAQIRFPGTRSYIFSILDRREKYLPQFKM